MLASRASRRATVSAADAPSAPSAAAAAICAEKNSRMPWQHTPQSVWMMLPAYTRLLSAM